jgi:hypothetical protein
VVPCDRRWRAHSFVRTPGRWRVAGVAFSGRCRYILGGQSDDIAPGKARGGIAVAVLDRPLYTVGQAARLLRIPSQTLRRWLDGTTVQGGSYPPVIREEATGSEIVTWGEFVEAGLLRGYREKKVPLQKMRPFIVEARREFKVSYPLAHFKPLIDHKDLVYELQIRTGLHSELALVRAEGGQMYLAPVVAQFLERVDFDPDENVIRLHPEGRESPVVIDPAIAFGTPQIRGIRTDLITESYNAGGAEEAALGWRVTPLEIDAAVSWERSLAKAA